MSHNSELREANRVCITGFKFDVPNSREARTQDGFLRPSFGQGMMLIFIKVS